MTIENPPTPAPRVNRAAVLVTSCVFFLCVCVAAGYSLIRLNKNLTTEPEPGGSEDVVQDDTKGRLEKDSRDREGQRAQLRHTSEEASKSPESESKSRRSGHPDTKERNAQPSVAEIAAEVQKDLAEERARRSAARNRAISEVREEVRKAEENAEVDSSPALSPP